MKRFTLSKSADRDFELIFMYGIDNYGLDKATIYQNNLIDRFHRIAQEPLLYPSVNDIRTGYKRSVYKINSIYYRIEKNSDIIIVRILGQQDPYNALN